MFVQVPEDAAKSDDLTLKEKGLLLTMSAYPDRKWTRQELQGPRQGRETTLSILETLINHKFVERRWVKEGKRQQAYYILLFS